MLWERRRPRRHPRGHINIHSVRVAESALRRRQRSIAIDCNVALQSGGSLQIPRRMFGESSAAKRCEALPLAAIFFTWGSCKLPPLYGAVAALPQAGSAELPLSVNHCVPKPPPCHAPATNYKLQTIKYRHGKQKRRRRHAHLRSL
jgi:hypothetical protein